MLDKVKVSIPPNGLPRSLYDDPDNYFTGDLAGGQLLPLRKFRVDAHGKKFAVIAGPGDALKVFASRDEDSGLIADSYEVNLPKLVYGHNGVPLNEGDLLLALSRLEHFLDALFDSRSVARKLIPGLSDEAPHDTVASWTKLEIACHRPDPEFKLFRAFSSASHPCSSKRLISPRESVRFGGKRSKTAVSIYLKKNDMVAKHKEDSVAGDDDVLRIEVILKSEHVIQAFRALGSRTVRIRNIGDRPQLVAFTWADLVSLHQSVIGKFSGAFNDAPRTKDKTDGMGIFIAEAFVRFGHAGDSDVHEWIDLFGAVNRVSADRVGRIRAACMQQLERSGRVSQNFADWFGETAYQNQPAVWVPKKERVTQRIRLDRNLSSAVVQVYAPDGFRSNRLAFQEGGQFTCLPKSLVHPNHS
jgi:hypothetical protein